MEYPCCGGYDLKDKEITWEPNRALKGNVKTVFFIISQFQYFIKINDYSKYLPCMVKVPEGEDVSSIWDLMLPNFQIQN